MHNHFLNNLNELMENFDNKNLCDDVWQGTWLCLPFYPYLSDRTSQQYAGNVFRCMAVKGVTFGELKKMLDAYVLARNAIFGISCSNSNYYIVRENKRFAFGVYYDGFYLWDDSGCTSLGHYSIDYKDIPSEDFIAWVDKVTKDYIDGYVHCSDCEKLIKYNEVAGQYFAGRYCSDCWNNRGWKEKEANETYN